MMQSVPEEDPFVRHIQTAAALENEGIELDRFGDNDTAIRKYEECLTELSAAIRTAFPRHVDDQPKLAQHRAEICDRIAHLKQMTGQPAIRPVEDHIHPVELVTHEDASAPARSSRGVKTVASCAAIGAGAGVVVLGATIGAPLALVGGAAAAGYVAMRTDRTGETARAAGSKGLAAAAAAKDLNEKHRLTEKLCSAGRAAGSAGLTAAVKAKDFNERHQVSEKVKCASKDAWANAKETNTKFEITTKIRAGVSSAVAKGREIDQKHQVKDKVKGGLSKGYDNISQAMEKHQVKDKVKGGLSKGYDKISQAMGNRASAQGGA